MENTTEKGNSLRDHVAKLARSAGYQNVTTEKYINGKKADVFYEQTDHFNRSISIVCECKNLKSPLDGNNLTQILTEYEPVLNNVDYLLIITHSGITSSGIDRLASKKNILHFTIDEYRGILIDFNHYLYSIQLAFNEKGLNQYYVPLRDNENNDLDTKIEDWITSDDCRPQAILAGYGMGKSSFATHLASTQAQRAMNDQKSRIPILLSLEGIYKEQDIKGLICRHLAYEHKVPGFNYEIFSELNRQGCLLVILDGFDEMKHAMSFEDFKSNIREFNSLVEKNSKIVILGRPNVFMSDDEKDSVLHGMKKIGTQEIHDAEMADYNEVSIKPFSNEQVKTFITNFLNYTAENERSTKGRELSNSFIEQRISELLDPKFSDLICRPVHAQMLCYLAVSSNDPLGTYSRYDLYSAFIDHFFDRELQKRTRAKISKNQREQFIQKLSWFLWLKGGKKSFIANEISNDIYEHLLDDESTSLDSLLRELLVGTVIESKGGGIHYFAHRSFQEFLVAQYIQSRHWPQSEIKSLATSVNQEIKDFLLESGKYEELLEKIEPALFLYTGEANLDFVYLMSHCLSKTKDKSKRYDLNNNGAWSLILSFFSELITATKEQSAFYQAANFCNNTFSRLNSSELRGVCMYLLAYAITNMQGQESRAAEIFCIRELISENSHYLRDAVRRAHQDGKLASRGEDEIMYNLFIFSIYPHFDGERLTGINFNPHDLFHVGEGLVEPSLSINGLDVGPHTDSRYYSLNDIFNNRENRRQEDKDILKGFFRRFPRPHETVPVYKGRAGKRGSDKRKRNIITLNRNNNP